MSYWRERHFDLIGQAERRDCWENLSLLYWLDLLVTPASEAWAHHIKSLASCVPISYSILILSLFWVCRVNKQFWLLSSCVITQVNLNPVPGSRSWCTFMLLLCSFMFSGVSINRLQNVMNKQNKKEVSCTAILQKGITTELLCHMFF